MSPGDLVGPDGLAEPRDQRELCLIDNEQHLGAQYAGQDDEDQYHDCENSHVLSSSRAKGRLGALRRIEVQELQQVSTGVGGDDELVEVGQHLLHRLQVQPLPRDLGRLEVLLQDAEEFARLAGGQVNALGPECFGLLQQPLRVTPGLGQNRLPRRRQPG